MWPFSTIRELRREARGYSDTLTELLVARAAGGEAPTGSAALTAAVEAAAGMWARAFASAEVTPEVPALTPEVLAHVGRCLIVPGEAVYVIRVRGGAVRLIPSGSWDVLGDSPDPSGWRYKLQLDAPSGSRTVTEPSAAVVHVRFSVDASRPWQGVGPITRAGLSADMLSALETRLGQEAGAPSAYVIPSPADGQATSTETLRSDVKSAKGGVVMAETMAAGYGDAAGAPQADWSQKRIGGSPPDVLRALRSDVGRAVVGACGVPEALIQEADGTAQREAWRRFVHGAVIPVSRIVARELADKLDAPGLAFDFGGLYASDVVGRAAAFSRMVQGGMDVSEAASLSGLIAGEE